MSNHTAIVPRSRCGESEIDPSDVERGRRNAERANELALAYRAGRTELLAALFDALRPILLKVIGRYGGQGHPLPAHLDPNDLIQQGWLILDILIHRWNPDGGDLAAYVRTAFPWELWRYVQAQSPGRRARATRVDNLHHDDLLEQLEDRPGVDGRVWDGQLITAEMLDALDALPRRALLLRLLEDQSFPEIAHALQLTCTGAFRQYRRALDCLRVQVGLEPDPDDASPEGDRRAIERLIRALHEGSGPDGRLPGRGWVCSRTGISEGRFARLIGLLVEHGCIEDRSARRPGRLVYATPDETLRRVKGQE